MPTIKLADNTEIFNYTLGAKLGSGAFGTVDAINETFPDGQALVCKTVRCTNPGFFGFGGSLPRQLAFRCTLNEINKLREVGMLAGYQYDRAQDQFIILMHRAPGVRENNHQEKQATFKALRKLHRQGIAHLDAKQDNFIYDNATGTAVDFGLAQDLNWLTKFLDFRYFHQQRGGFNLKALVSYYLDEIIDYAQNNKLQFAKDLFFMATITIAACTGASVFGVGAMLAKELIRRTLRLEYALIAWTDFNHYAAANTKQVLWSFGQKAKETVQHAVEYICPGQVPTPV